MLIENELVVGLPPEKTFETLFDGNNARQSMTKLSLTEFKALVRTQTSILRMYRDQALESLPNFVPLEAKRKELLRTVRAGALAIGPMTPVEEDCLARLARFLGLGSIRADPEALNAAE